MRLAAVAFALLVLTMVPRTRSAPPQPPMLEQVDVQSELHM